MAAGLQVDRNYINQKVGSVALQIREMLHSASVTTAALNIYDAAALESTFGFTTADAADMADALYSLGLLVNVANGNQALPVATDLLVGLKKITGID